jgi:23S rRNA G2069 N7-methylase RlmK/C1962 C5-methylase RlmI
MENTFKPREYTQEVRVRLITKINKYHEQLFNCSIEPQDFDRLYDKELDELHGICYDIFMEAELHKIQV